MQSVLPIQHLVEHSFIVLAEHNLTPDVLTIMLMDCRTDAVLYHLHHRPHQLRSGVPTMESSEQHYMIMGHMLTTAQDD